MKLGISEFKVGKETIKFKTPLLLEIQGANIHPTRGGTETVDGVCASNDEISLSVCDTSLLMCSEVVLEELGLLWEAYALVPDNELTKDAITTKNKLLAMTVDTPKTFEISKVRYPSLNRIIMVHPNPEILLGHRIYWEEKRDGSNMGAYLTEKGDLALRSRNRDKASESFHRIFLETDEAENVKEMLIYMRDEWNDKCVVFGELLAKGKSPTRTEMHEKHEFVVFDIWSSKGGGFLSYLLVGLHCHHFDISVVELYGESQHTTLGSLLEFRDKMFETAKKNGREGVVGKTYEKGTMYLYFKEKLDTPKLEKAPNHIGGGKSLLPSLPESEILGALDKTLVDLGMMDFKDVRKAMPLFAEYVGEECGKHHCRKPKGTLFTYYKAKREEMKKVIPLEKQYGGEIAR